MDFQNFDTIKETYTQEYCESLELAYGAGMMSEGGEQGLKDFFSHVDMSNKVALDFGSGMGGAAIFAAKEFNSTITGIEINKRMIDAATARIPYSLKSKVSFTASDSGVTLPVSNASFDVVYSKGVIVHLNGMQRQAIYDEFFRVLKPGGKLLVLDWLSPVTGQWGDLVEKMAETENLPLHPQSLNDYVDIIKKSGFVNISTEDESELYAIYNRQIVNRLSTEVKAEFVSKFSEEVLAEHTDGYMKIAKANELKELFTTLVVAEKPDEV